MKIKEFLFNSFRPRTKADYKRLFFRGLEAEGVNLEYPWFYLRVFAVLAVVFTIYAVINACLPGAGDFEAFYFIGGAFMDVAFLTLLFELYPYNDFSLIKLCAVCLIGGTAACFLSSLLYFFHDDETLDNGWKLAAIAGVGEEIAKAIPALVCIYVLKKKSPQAGLLIGAAVGTWFSLVENASYIHGSYTFGRMVLTASARAFGCAFSHAPWTALICFAFCKLKKPFLNFRFYGVALFCMATHFCIDMPLTDILWLLFLEASICGLATFALFVYAIYTGRKEILNTEVILTEIVPFTPARKADLTAAGFASALCVLLLAFSGVFSTTSYEKTFFDNEKDLFDFAVAGYAISPDYERQYDKNYYNYYAAYQDGVLISASQRIEGDGFVYEYEYNLTEVESDENAEENEKIMKLAAVNVVVKEDGEEIFYRPLTYSFDEVSVTVYHINPELDEGYINYENGKFVFIEPFERLTVPSIVLLSLSAATAVSGICAYVILRKRAT